MSLKNPTGLFLAGVLVGLAVVVCGAGRQPRDTSAPTRWEYRIESYARLSGIASLGNALEKVGSLEELEALSHDMASRMTDLGHQGWELVCIQGNHGFVFKRRIP